MLVGTADVSQLAEGAAEVAAFVSESILLEEVVCLQLTAEMRNSARESLLPPSLHPTIPPALVVQVYQVGHSPWGAFRFATARISCRSGVRARGFTTRTVVDGAAALAGLRGSLGFPAVAGEIELRHGYDGVSAEVRQSSGSIPEGKNLEGKILKGKILEIVAIDPEPLGSDDVQYTGTLNLANTPMGLRLMQVEGHAQCRQVERVSARMPVFDGAAWGNRLLEPSLVVATSVALMNLEYPPVRFVCRPDELAFTGTESVR